MTVSYKLRFRRQIVSQGLFWIIYFILDWLNSLVHTDEYRASFYYAIITLPVFILAGYWYLQITVKHFLFQSKRTGFIVSLLSGVVGFGLLRRVVVYLFFYPNFHPDGLTKPILNWQKLFDETMQLHFVAGLFVAIEIGRHALQQQRLNETYKREKLSAEFQLLQSQVQPHFLFNTLNNLVSVSMHQPGQIPHLLQRLAGLLSYQLHESHRLLVSVKKETEYLLDYIALEKIRYGNRLDVQTNFSELSNFNDIMIPPMILLPFVENAFKHGAAQTEASCWIQLQLVKNGNRLVFTVENFIAGENIQTKKSGIGLANLKKRLDILFPGNYEVVTLQEESQFLSVLKFSPDSVSLK